MNAPAAPPPATQFVCPRQFPSWLEEQNISLAFSTYQAGKLFLIGRAGAGQLSASDFSAPNCMGIWASADRLWMGSRVQVWRFENILAAGAQRGGRDRVFVPRAAYTTGDLDTPDVAVDAAGELVFVNTRFNCLAALDERQSFRAVWRPPFISKLAAEDRCHLNGLAMRDGAPAFVTAVSRSDVVDGWRDRRADGGVVIDVRSGEIVAEGLSMPHSPRWYRDRLWVHDSGRGFFGYVDLARGTFEPVTFCPGYLRGLAFSGDYAIVGLSRPRHQRTFGGLVLEKNLADRGAEPRCGVHVIDLRTGDIAHWLRLEGAIQELYDVVTLPGVRSPEVVALDSEALGRTITVDAAAAAALFQ